MTRTNIHIRGLSATGVLYVWERESIDRPGDCCVKEIGGGSGIFDFLIDRTGGFFVLVRKFHKNCNCGWLSSNH